MKRLIIVAALFALTGCATQDYKMYTDTQRSMAIAQYQADAQVETAKWNALAEAAKTGDVTAKVAVAMAVQASSNGGNGGLKNQQNQVAAPRSIGDYAFQWASLIVPTTSQFLTAAYTVKKQTDLGIAQSNNAAATAASTNAAMTNIAGAGFNAVTSTTNAGYAATTSIANSGFASNASIANSGFASATAIAGKIQAPQPNVTISGNTGASINAGNVGTSASGQASWWDSRDMSNKPVTTTTTSTSTTSTLTCTTGPC